MVKHRQTPDKRGCSGARGIAPPGVQVLPGAHHFGFNDDFGLHPRRYSMTRGTLRLSLAMSTSAFTLVDTVRLEGLPPTFGDDDFCLHPRQYSSTCGARHLPSATTTSAFALVDTVRLEGLAVHLRRRLLRSSPWSIQFDSRGSPSTFGNDYFGLRPHRNSSTRRARHLPSATTTLALTLVDTVRLEGLAIYLWRRLLQPSPSLIQFESRGSPSTFDDIYFGLRPRRYSSTREARRLPLAMTTSAFALIDTVQLEELAVCLYRRPSSSSRSKSVTTWSIIVMYE